MKRPSVKKRPPIYAIWLVTLLFLGLSAITVWAKPGQDSLRWTIPTFTPTPTPSTGNLCVLVYHDENRDGVRQPSEELLPGANIEVRNVQSGVVFTQTTEGGSDPCCFLELTPGLYSVREQDPPGFLSTTDNSWGAVISANVSIQVPFGDFASHARVTLPLILNARRNSQ